MKREMKLRLLNTDVIALLKPKRQKDLKQLLRKEDQDKDRLHPRNKIQTPPKKPKQLKHFDYLDSWYFLIYAKKSMVVFSSNEEKPS